MTDENEELRKLREAQKIAEKRREETLGKVTSPQALDFRFESPFTEHGPACPECSAELCTNGRCIDCDDRARAKSRDMHLAMSDFGANIPARWLWADFRSPLMAARVRDSKAIERATLLGAKQSAVLVGAAGSGKTSLACAVARLRALAGTRLDFAGAHELARARASHGLGEGEPETVRTAMRVPLLILDDLGQDKDTQQNAIADVIYSRHERELCTLITTAMAPDAVAARYGDGVSRRVYEGAVLINCRGGSK